MDLHDVAGPSSMKLRSRDFGDAIPTVAAAFGVAPQ